MTSPDQQFVSIRDNRSSIRESFLKKWFANNYDVLSFFHFLAGQTKLPIVGPYFLRPIMELYYHNFHPGSHILPRREIETVINASSHLHIDPCICRVFSDDCDSPIYSCLRINFAAEVRLEETGNSLSKEEALEIVRNAGEHGLIFSLEHCIRPYQYNICMCCSCCCVPKKFRYQFGLNVYKSGPYIPEVDEQLCLLCRTCERKCPVSAISQREGKIDINIPQCLGCGVCEDTCPNGAVTMSRKRAVRRNESEPGKLNLYCKRIFLQLVLIPLAAVYRLSKGSRQYRVNDIEPRAKDVYGK